MSMFLHNWKKKEKNITPKTGTKKRTLFKRLIIRPLTQKLQPVIRVAKGTINKRHTALKSEYQ